MLHSLRFTLLFLSSFLFISIAEAGLKACATTEGRSAATLAGVVLDPDGRPAPGVRVIATRGPRIDVSSTTDAQGLFRLTPLDAGDYEVRVSLEGFRAEPLQVTLRADEQRDVTIHLRLSAVSESVVVTAARVDLPRSRVGESVAVIEEADLARRQIESVADAVRLVPGLAATRSGGRGAITSIFPRGGESDFTLVVADGIRLNDFGGGFDFAHLPIAGVERIEVVRGPQSALFGSEAIGAVVQVVTRRSGAPQADALLEAGSFATRHVAGSTSGSAARWSWGAAGDRLSSDGFTGVAPATGERVSNDDYTRSSGTLSLGWHAASFDVRGDVRVARNERGFPGPFGSNPIGFFTEVDRLSRGVNETRAATVAATRTWNTRVRQRMHAGVADLDSSFTSPFGPSETESVRQTFGTQIDLSLAPGLGVSTGIEAQREQARNTYIQDQQFQPTPVRRFAAGYFGELQYHAHPRLALTGGLRVEQIARDRLDPDPFGSRPAFSRDTVVSANPKISASYLAASGPSQWTRLRATAGTGIRAPNAFEIAFTNNPGLKPERSRSGEIAIEQGIAGGAVVFESAAFFNRYEDLIVAVRPSFRNASRWLTDNISNARSHGVELAASARTRHGLAARVGYTFLSTRILAVDGTGVAPDPFTPGDPLLRRPRHQGSIDVVYAGDRVTVFGALGARGRVLDVEPSLGTFGGLFRTPGYATVDAGAAVRVIHTIEAFARITNLFDRRYEEALGFPALGRSVMAGVRVAARR